MRLVADSALPLVDFVLVQKTEVVQIPDTRYRWKGNPIPWFVSEQRSRTSAMGQSSMIDPVLRHPNRYLPGAGCTRSLCSVSYDTQAHTEIVLCEANGKMV